MITKEKIAVYTYFNGDIDGWARAGTRNQKAIMNDKDWLLIEELLQDIRLLKRGLASETYMHSIKKRMSECCDSSNTISELEALAQD